MRSALNMLPSILLYAALVATLIGLASLVRPLRRLGIRTRARASLAVLVAVVLALGTMCAPVRPTRVSAPTSLLDELSPDYHVHEVHQTRVAASPERTFAAIKTVTADEIGLFQTLRWIRRFGRPGPESILNAPGQQPLLEVAARTTFLLLAESPPREVVVGTVVFAEDLARARALTPETFRDLRAHGFVKATMNFRVEPDGAGSVVTTETRVFGTDNRAIRRFLPYWRVILPGSAILRVTWLRAISRRARSM